MDRHILVTNAGLELLHLIVDSAVGAGVAFLRHVLDHRLGVNFDVVDFEDAHEQGALRHSCGFQSVREQTAWKGCRNVPSQVIVAFGPMMNDSGCMLKVVIGDGGCKNVFEQFFVGFAKVETLCEERLEF